MNSMQGRPPAFLESSLQNWGHCYWGPCSDYFNLAMKFAPLCAYGGSYIRWGIHHWGKGSFRILVGFHKKPISNQLVGPCLFWRLYQSVPSFLEEQGLQDVPHMTRLPQAVIPDGSPEPRLCWQCIEPTACAMSHSTSSWVWKDGIHSSKNAHFVWCHEHSNMLYACSDMFQGRFSYSK